MGQSTDAYLAFGFDLGDGEEIEWPEALRDPEEADTTHPDLDGFIARKAGLARPETEDYKDPKWAAYWSAKRDAEAAYPVDLVAHCSGDYSMWVVALRRTVQRATRGSPEDAVMSAVMPEEVAAMKAFCDEVDLPWSEPKWLLFSMWN